MVRKKLIVGAMMICTLIFLAIILLGVHSSANSNTKELKLVHVIMRHGIRTPATTYPNDPYINETYAPIGWGQLTNQGKLELYETGKFLRQRYDNFLGPQFSTNLFYTQSTDVDRTKASVQLVNAGLWPPSGAQKWGPLDWQPIPVHSEPLEEDSLLLVRRPCAQYHLELARVMRTNEIRAKIAQNQQLFTDLAKITGLKVDNFDDVQDIYSTLRAQEAFNLTLPDWTKAYYPDKLLPPTIFSFVLNAYSDKLKRLKGGVLLKQLLAHWRSAQEQNTVRAYLYGGHDSTVTNLMSALKVWDPQMPEYGITVLFEFSLDKITNEHGVEIFLRNSTRGQLHRLTVPGCEQFCALSKLTELTRSVIPDDWEEECRSDDPDYEPPPAGGP